MYKDKEKQRLANRGASQRRRDQLKALANAVIPCQSVISEAEGMTNQGMTVSGSDTHVIPKRGKDIKLSFNAGDISRCSKMRDMSDVLAKPKRGHVRVSKPGDDSRVLPALETPVVTEFTKTKMEGGLVPKVPKPPRRAGVLKS